MVLVHSWWQILVLTVPLCVSWSRSKPHDGLVHRRRRLRLVVYVFVRLVRKFTTIIIVCIHRHLQLQLMKGVQLLKKCLLFLIWKSLMSGTPKPPTSVCSDSLPIHQREIFFFFHLMSQLLSAVIFNHHFLSITVSTRFNQQLEGIDWHFGK